MKVSKRQLRRMIKEELMRESSYDVGSGLEDGPRRSKDPLENIATVVQSVVDAGKGLFDMVPYLQSAGFNASVTTSPLSMVTVETHDGMVAVLSSKLAEDPDITVGPYVIGKME
jgi:hypothetical protein